MAASPFPMIATRWSLLITSPLDKASSENYNMCPHQKSTTVFGDKRGVFRETFAKNSIRDSVIALWRLYRPPSSAPHVICFTDAMSKNSPARKIGTNSPGREVFDVAVNTRLDSPAYGQWGIAIRKQRSTVWDAAKSGT